VRRRGRWGWVASSAGPRPLHQPRPAWPARLLLQLLLPSCQHACIQCNLLSVCPAAPEALHAPRPSTGGSRAVWGCRSPTRL
jgi:hypothetical protein